MVENGIQNIYSYNTFKNNPHFGNICSNIILLLKALIGSRPDIISYISYIVTVSYIFPSVLGFNLYLSIHTTLRHEVMNSLTSALQENLTKD